jgi:centrosomal protein CEP76
MEPSTGNGVALPAAKIAELKSLIDSHLRSQNVYGQIRDFVRDTAKDGDDAGKSGGEEATASASVVMDALREKGVIEQVIKSIRRPNNMASPSSLDTGGGSLIGSEGRERLAPIAPVPSPFRRFLHLRINGGRAFVEHLSDPSLTAPGAQSKFILFIHFRNQRYRSRAVPVSVEPAFDESILLDLQSPDSTSLVDLGELVKLDAKIHIVLARLTSAANRPDAADVEGGSEVELVASYDVEWRNVLGSGGMTIPAELLGAGSQAKIKVPVGVLDMRLDIVPNPETRVPHSDISRGLKASAVQKQELQRQFFQYSRIWWKEYTDVNPSFKNRLVKIFAEDEWGGHKPVCYFVRPLTGGRVIDSPRHAARFVSLIPYTKVESIGAGAGRTEIWHTFHTFLSLRKGDCEDHAVLLCSMLLGFGLDAYVCNGTVVDNNDVERDHLWVMTRSPGRGKGVRRVVFWESLTGQRYPHRAQDNAKDGATVDMGNSKMPKYGTVGCCFNNTCFYANKQVSDAVATCRFNFEDGNLWKGMDQDILVGIEHQEQVPFCPSTLNPLATEEALERALRPMIADYRRANLKLGTPWDAQLGYLLTPALAAYEMERLAGTPFGNEEFQQSIKRNVPEGHTFRGYPIVVNRRSPTRIMESFRRAQIASDILNTRGDHVNFALRVKIFAYPEDICAVWVMLAVKFRPN